MQFFSETKIDFISKRTIAFIISGTIILIGIISLIINNGPKYSIDFLGGTLLELDFTPVDANAESIKIQDIRDVSFGIAAVIALFHDVFITIGIFSIFGREISLPVIAALLTIVGYSLNDTIVVFDRIREDLKIYRRDKFKSVINHSINETLSRTVITSLTTFVVVLSLFLFGGSVIHNFALALLIGIIVGTYSSIFVASPVLVEYYVRKFCYE